jgi:AcrR family transcriptional regulator
MGTIAAMPEGKVYVGKENARPDDTVLDDLRHIGIECYCCHNAHMPKIMTDNEAALRRARILTAARWCFLNFGFAKTAFENIAKRASLSRTLLYRIFKDKEEIYQAVFVDWLVSRHPAAKQAAKGPGSPYERLFSVCQLMALEPWAEMVTTEMLGRVGVTGERITSGMTTEQRGRYATLMHAIISQAQAAIPKGVPAEEAGRVIADAITSKRPRTRYTVGREAALLPLFAILPDRMLDRILAAALRPHFPKESK